jgi:hypothetical protein
MELGASASRKPETETASIGDAVDASGTAVKVLLQNSTVMQWDEA